MCMRKGFQNVCAMCVRAAFFQVCDVRSQFRTFRGKKGPILDLFWLLRLLSNAFPRSYFTLIPNKHKEGIKSTKFATKLLFCYKRACGGAK